MSLQLVCINYGNLWDAIKAVSHCQFLFKRFSMAPTIFHPNLGDPRDTNGMGIIFREAKSPTQNECCLYEMPQYITCDHAIGIQWDGFIVNPDAWTDEFLEYDYIAPPWPLTNIINPEHRVGSGGFCMFSKRMANLWGQLCEPHPAPNDWGMGAIHRQRFEDRGIKYAPLELAMRFGREITCDGSVENPFGFHSFRQPENEKYRKIIYDNNMRNM